MPSVAVSLRVLLVDALRQGRPALAYWCEIHKGARGSLEEFQECRQ